MCDDLLLTSQPSVYSLVYPGGTDESELGADVSLMIICLAYQHLLPSSHRCVILDHPFPKNILDPNSLCIQQDNTGPSVIFELV